MNSKSIFQSKTFWVQIVALLSMAVPQVQTWLSANPEQFVAVLAAVNVLVRFATSGKITLSGAGETENNIGGGPGGLPLWIGILGTAAVIGGLLPSCSTSGYPITGSVAYLDPASGAKAGLVFSPGQPIGGTVKIPVFGQDGQTVGYVDLKSGK